MTQVAQSGSPVVAHGGTVTPPSVGVAHAGVVQLSSAL